MLPRLAQIGWLASALFAATSWAAVSPSEYQLKAVFLFNFAQFVQWPAQAFPSAKTPFFICVIGSDPFGVDLDNVVRSEVVNDHPLAVRRIQTAAQGASCNLLYIADSERSRLQQILSAVHDRPILTVSDATAEQQPSGVMIQLLKESNRIRLRIDLAAAKAAQLTISSNLLRPAQIVGGSTGD